MKNRYCKQCKKRLNENRPERAKFCSHACYWRSKIGKPHGHKTSDGHTPYHKGKKRLEATGNKNINWKGNEVKYRALHSWVERKLGKPDTCQECGANGLSGRKIHWANKSGEYKRKLDDWIRLCASCHGSYDKKGGYYYPNYV